MIAPDDSESLAGTAAELGFDHRQRTFPSSILARHLGELCGRDTVPTTMFKAWTRPPGQRAVEVAIPYGVEAGTVRSWVGSGIGAHVAFRVERPERLEELRPILEEAGFRTPAFMQGAAVANPAEGISAMIFDRRPVEPLGIEFCHYD